MYIPNVPKGMSGHLHTNVFMRIKRVGDLRVYKILNKIKIEQTRDVQLHILSKI